MLRGVVGDEKFFEILKEYSTSPELIYNHSTTEDFQTICENVSSQNLDFFFDQWVYDEFYPQYKVEFEQNDLTLQAELSIKQTQSSLGWRNIFKMPVDVKFNFEEKGDTVITFWNDQANQSFDIQFTDKIGEVIFDPDYWLLRQDLTVTNIEEEYQELPSEFALYQNYPNPFNPSTTIEYEIAPSPSQGEGPREGFAVSLKIFNLLGQEVATLVNELQSPGNYKIRFDANSLPSGVYIYKLEAGVFERSKKMLLIR